MELAEIRHLYHEYQRRNVIMSGMRREESHPVVRYINSAVPRSMIMCSILTPNIVDDTVEREILYFKKLGHTFEWKLFDYDQPPDLKDRLARQGFEIGEEEAVMVLDIHNLPDPLQKEFSHDIRLIIDADAAVAIMNAVQNPVFGSEPDNWINDNIRVLLTDDPEHIGFYAAYVDDAPVSAAWIFYYPNGNPFGGLYGGATLEAHRGKGFYSALVAARAKAARERGVRFLMVDASPMSRPILEKIGFQWIASSWEAVYHGSAARTE